MFQIDVLETRRLFAGFAPDSIEGYRVNGTISSGSLPLAGSGSFVISIARDGSGYTLVGSGGVADSEGTYRYTKTSDNGAVLKANDSLLGVAVPYSIKMTATNRGTFKVSLSGASQAGTFSLTPPVPLGKITGRVYDDKNADGRQGAGEGALSSVKLFIDANKNGKPEASEKTTLTDASGNYHFDAFSAGTFNVREVPPTGYRGSNPESLRQSVVVLKDQAVSRIHFGNTRLASISGTVFGDVDADGVNDPAETGTAGFVVFDDGDGDGKLDPAEASVRTDSDGAWRFRALPAGKHAIRLQVTQDDFKRTTASRVFVTVASGGSSVGTSFGVNKIESPVVSNPTGSLPTSIAGTSLFLKVSGGLGAFATVGDMAINTTQTDDVYAMIGEVSVPGGFPAGSTDDPNLPPLPRGAGSYTYTRLSDTTAEVVLKDNTLHLTYHLNIVMLDDTAGTYFLTADGISGNQRGIVTLVR